MNTSVRLSAVDLPTLFAHMARASVGFDTMFDRLNNVAANSTNSVNYPPHNIVKHNDTCYTIEIAVAGFAEDEINITVEDNALTIKGDKQGDAPEYVHQGISNKSFSKTLTLAEHVEVLGAVYDRGLLMIDLEIVVPEELKPRKIEITKPKIEIK